MSHDEHEEMTPLSPASSWLLVVGLCAAIWAWGLLNYVLIPDRPATWDLGSLPDVPSQSEYSSGALPAGTPTTQVHPLPEVQDGVAPTATKPSRAPQEDRP